MRNYTIAIAGIFLTVWELRKGRLQAVLKAVTGDYVIAGATRKGETFSPLPKGVVQ